MAKFSVTLICALTAIAVHALPVEKRISQTISDSTTQWVQACNTAGGGEECSNISVTAFQTLLAAAGPCDQQNSADAMVDLAKQLNSDADMIKFAQIFAQQPRNSPTSQAVQYCQQAPKNAKLNGLFQCQFQSADEQTFVGGVAVGSPGTVPLGLSAPLSPAGSCPANPTGPIPDGQQLVDITQDPGLENIQSGSTVSSSASGASSAASASATSAAPANTSVSASASSVTQASASAVASTASVASSAAPPPAASNTSTCTSTSSKKKRASKNRLASAGIAKRIAQDTTAAATPWENACTAAGGGAQCNTIAVTAFGTLLAAAGACDQQDSADAMIDLAHTLNNDADMIRLAQIFAQQPRNTPTSQAVPYCQTAPKNAELNGLFQCQFQSADEQTFVGGLAVGANGTIPFGMTAPVNPPGSCPASPQIPVPDGLQLLDFIASTNGTASATASSAAATATSSAVGGGDDDDDDCEDLE